MMPLPTAGQHGEKRRFIGVSTSPTGIEHSARNVGIALTISHGPDDSRDRPAVVTIDRKRRRKRVELTNALFEYIEIFTIAASTLGAWRLVIVSPVEFETRHRRETAA